MLCTGIKSGEVILNIHIYNYLKAMCADSTTVTEAEASHLIPF